jgi:hypothetical protein
MELTEIMNRSMEMARSIVTSGKEVLPYFVYETDRGEIGYVPTPWANEEHKVNLLKVIRLLFLVEDVQRYVMCSETWVATVNSMDDPLMKVAPRDRSDRKEMILVLGVERDRPNRTMLAEIERFGGITVGEVKHDVPGVDFTGRMTELLPPVDVNNMSLEERDALRGILGMMLRREKVDV